jgi:hypothetical protein
VTPDSAAPKPTPDSAAPKPTPDSSAPKPTPDSSVPAVSSAFAFYGVPWSADSLQNWSIGGPEKQRWSYRFRTPKTGSLQHLRVFFIPNPVGNSKTGYAGGNGGTIRVDLCPDDGTPLHAPSCATVLGTVTKGGFGLTGGAPPAGYSQTDVLFPTLAFASPVPVKGDTLYHAVFTNIDPSPTTNWIGLDGLIEFPSASPAAVRPSFTDWGLLLGQTGTSQWVDWTTGGGASVINTPTMAVVYADGTSFGCGYMEVWPSSSQARVVDGTRAVRETFVASRPVTVAGVGVRAMRTSSGGALSIRLESGSGALLAEATVNGSAVSTAKHDWVSASFSAPQTLVVGQAYNLVLRGASSGSFLAHCVRDGQTYGFEAGSVFADGHAQFDAADGQGFLGWYGWATAGSPSYKDGDLQFYFVPK